MTSIKNQNIFFIVVILISLQSTAQIDQFKNGDLNRQAWFDYNFNYHKTDRFNIYGDTGFRIISPYIWTRYYIRPAVSYTPKPLFKKGDKLRTTYHFGIGTFFTNYVELPNHIEIRPFQGIQLNWPSFKNISFSHYARLEQQIENFDGGWSFGVRARYMLSGNITWGNNNENVINSFFFPFHVELFWNLDNTAGFNDVIRITPGLGYHFNPNWRLEFSTSYHKRKFAEADNFETNDIVFRLRIYYDIF